MSKLGEIAYNAFADARHWRTFNGDIMPTWDAQQENMREAWSDSAEAVIGRYFADHADNPDVRIHVDTLIDRAMAKLAASDAEAR